MAILKDEILAARLDLTGHVAAMPSLQRGSSRTPGSLQRRMTKALVRLPSLSPASISPATANRNYSRRRPRDTSYVRHTPPHAGRHQPENPHR